MDTDNTTIEQVMAAIAAGDPTFVFTLIERFGHRVQWVVRHHLRDMGRHDLLADADEMRGLTLDACFAIADRAGAWRAGVRFPACGPTWPSEPSCTPVPATAASSSTRSLRPARARTPRRHRAAVPDARGDRPPDAGLRPGAAPGGQRPDYGVFVEHLVQQELGDPSPAHSVAELFELSPANVRQIVCRTRRRLDAERVAA